MHRRDYKGTGWDGMGMGVRGAAADQQAASKASN